MAEFSIGDSVTFISGAGPLMTVKSVCTTDGADSYLCCWFTPGEDFREYWFSPSLLKRKHPPKTFGFIANKE